MILTETKISNSNLQQPYIFHSALLLYLYLECVQYLYVELNELTVQIYIYISPQNFIDPIIQ